MSDELSLEDLSPEDRKALPYDHPMLDAYAASMEQKHGLPTGLIRAIKNAGEQSQSTGKGSVSPKGAQGVMQFMPDTAAAVGVKDPTDPVSAIGGSGQYLASISKDLGTTDPVLLAAGYNAGPNRASLRKGLVPPIPETQGYVSRVSKYMAGMQPPTAPPAAGSAPALSWSDLSPEDRAAMRKANPDLDPTNGMSFTDKLLAGAGKMFSDTGRGAAQLATDLVINPLSRKVTGKDLVDNMHSDEADSRVRDESLMGTGAGMAGYLGAGMALTALPGSMLAKAAPVAAATNLASKVPLIGGALATAVPASITGAALSAAAPVAADGERADNAKAGAVMGPLAALAGQGAGKVVKAVANQFPDLTAALGKVSVPGWRPSWNNTLNSAEQEAVQTAASQGVPIYPSQLAKPGSSLSAGQASGQRDAFDRAVARSMGEDTTDLVSAFSNAKNRLSGNFDTLLRGKTIDLGPEHINDLAKVSAYNSARSPRFAPNPDLEDSVQRAIEAAKQNPTMSGDDWQQALRGYKAEVLKQSQGTATNPSDPYAAKGYGMMIDALTKQAQNAMSPEELSLFNQTNKQWRNMSMLETLAPKDANGNINPKQLANVLARKDKSAFIYGKGDTTLSNLARYGGTYMGLDSTAPTSLLQRGKALAGAAAPMLAGDVAGAAILSHGMGGNDNNEGSLAGETAKLLALGALTHGAISGVRRAANPALSLGDLSAPRGALGELASRMRLGDAAALTYNAQKEH